MGLSQTYIIIKMENLSLMMAPLFSSKLLAVLFFGTAGGLGARIGVRTAHLRVHRTDV